LNEFVKQEKEKEMAGERVRSKGENPQVDLLKKGKRKRDGGGKGERDQRASEDSASNTTSCST
jgi:hypothetical protein